MILDLKRTPGLYLVGFMGSGKSTVGRALAEQLGWPFRDLDDVIESAQQRTIASIFDTEGEAPFRQIESAALLAQVRQVESGHPLVLALGGGAYAQDPNRDILRGRGVTLWLDCPFERLARRVAQDAHRPLARDPERFAQLFNQRRAAYALADHRIPFDSDDPRDAVQAILDLHLL